MAKLVSKIPQVVPLGTMKDGDIAEIVEWNPDCSTIGPGDLITRYKDIIIPIGKPSGLSYTSILKTERAEKNKVVILKGEVTIII